MKSSSDLLLLLLVLFLGSSAVAVWGAERKGRVALEVLGWIIAGIALRYAIEILFGQQILGRCPMHMFVMIVGIGASAARSTVNQMAKLGDLSAD